MAFKDHHSRAATPEYKESWDRMYSGTRDEPDLSMDRYLQTAGAEQSYPEWKYDQLYGDRARRLAALRMLEHG